MSLGPLDGVSHVCRKVFTVAIAEVPGGAEVFIRMSIMTAHEGREGVSVVQHKAQQTRSKLTLLKVLSVV